MATRVQILQTYGNFVAGTRSDSVGLHKRHYAVVYRFGHPILWSGKSRQQAIDRLYDDIYNLMYEDVIRLG